jgi:hypothetical protein
LGASCKLPINTYISEIYIDFPYINLQNLRFLRVDRNNYLVLIIENFQLL